jgi:hypothetical protein
VEGRPPIAGDNLSTDSEVLELMERLMHDFEYVWYLSLLIFFGILFALIVLANILFGVLTGV